MPEPANKITYSIEKCEHHHWGRRCYTQKLSHGSNIFIFDIFICGNTWHILKKIIYIYYYCCCLTSTPKSRMKLRKVQRSFPHHRPGNGIFSSYTHCQFIFVFPPMSNVVEFVWPLKIDMFEHQVIDLLLIISHLLSLSDGCPWFSSKWDLEARLNLKQTTYDLKYCWGECAISSSHLPFLFISYFISFSFHLIPSLSHHLIIFIHLY